MFEMNKTQKEYFSELLASMRWYDVWKTMNEVKPLPLIPGLNMVTVYQLAEYFGISVGFIKNVEKKNGVINYQLNRRLVKPDELKYLAFKTNLITYEGVRHISYKFKGFSIHASTSGTVCYTPQAVVNFLPYITGSKVCAEITSRIIKGYDYTGRASLQRCLLNPLIKYEESETKKVSVNKSPVIEKVVSEIKRRKPSVTVAVTAPI